MGIFNKKEREEQQRAYLKLEYLYHNLFQENEQNKLAIIERDQEIRNLKVERDDEFERRKKIAAENDELKQSVADADTQKLNAIFENIISDKTKLQQLASNTKELIDELSAEDDRREVARQNLSEAFKHITMKNEQLVKKNKQLNKQLSRSERDSSSTL